MISGDLAINGGEPILDRQATYCWPKIDKDGEKDVLEQLRKGLSIYDRSGVIKDFEDRFALLHGKKHGLVTSSGTAAIHSAFYSLGISPGDEVICPTYTFFATAVPLFQLGALPVLADCDEYGSMNPDEIEPLVNQKTKAVVITHMWGLPCNIGKIRKICDGKNLPLIEDCSHAHGATYNGKLVGTFGKMGVWSLQAQKIICAGEGGIMLTDDDLVYDRAQLLGHFNKRAMQEIPESRPYYKYAVTGLGLKYRAHPLGIAFALGQLGRLEGWVKNKRHNAERIRRILSQTDIVPLYPELNDRKSSYYAFPMLVNKEITGFSRELLVSAMHAEGFTDIDMPNSTSPLHGFAAFNEPVSPVTKYSHHHTRGSYPNAERIASQIVKISVPVESPKESVGERFIDSFEKVLLKILPSLQSK